MRIVVTGGAGFIGSNLARYSLSSGAEVVIVDDFSTGLRSNIASLDVTLYEGSILDRELLTRAVDGADAVVHLGAIPSVARSVAEPVPCHDANATGTLNVLEVARMAGVRHVSVASSSSVYGANTKLPKSEYDYTRPMSPYAASKLAAESYALAYQFAYGVPTIAFRFFNVYGPGQRADHDYAAVIPRFLGAALQGRPVQVHGDGLQSRDFTFVETVCAVLYHAASAGVTDRDPVNLAYHTNTTLLDLLTLMESKLNQEIQRLHVEPRVGDVRASQADSSRLTRLFPQIVPVSLEEGLTRTIEWMRDAQR